MNKKFIVTQDKDVGRWTLDVWTLDIKKSTIIVRRPKSKVQTSFFQYFFYKTIIILTSTQKI